MLSYKYFGQEKGIVSYGFLDDRHRLNSYSQQHPVYLALRELGRVVRTEFLLRYMDD